MTYLFIQIIKTRCKSKNKDNEDVRVHDIYCKPKSYKFKLLEKLVTQ